MNAKKLKHKSFRKVICWTMSLVLTLPAWSSGDSIPTPSESAMKEALLRHFGPNPPDGASISVRSHQIEGVTTHYLSASYCKGSIENCNMRVIGKIVEPVQRYRESVAIVQQDGLFVAVETVDSFRDNSPQVITPNTKIEIPTAPESMAEAPRRLDLTATTWQNKPGSNEPDLTSMLNFRPTIEPNLSQQIAPYLPGLVHVAQSSLQNFQQALQTSMAMHQAYKANLARLDSVAANFRAQAANVAEASALNRALAGVSLGEIVADISRTQRSPEVQRQLSEFRKLKSDPFAYKQYELTESAKADLQQKLSEAIKRGQVRAAARLSEIGLNQTDPKEREQFEKFIGEAQLDGVIQVGHVAPNVGAAPLDGVTFQTERMSPGGQAIRRVANLAQAYWEEQDGFRSSDSSAKAAYLSALSTLAWADNVFVQGHLIAGFALLDFSQSLLHGSVGFAKGVGRSAVNLVQSIPELAEAASALYSALREDPEAVVDAAGRIVASSPQILDAMAIAAVEAGQKFIEGDAAYRGEILGLVAGDILIGAVTGGIGSGVTKSAQAAKVINLASKGANATADLIARTPQLASAVGRAATTVAETTSYFKGPRRASLLNLAKQDRKLALGTLGAVRHALKEGSTGAADFIARASRSSATYMRSEGGAQRAVEAYIDLERRMQLVAPTSYEGTISRAVVRELEINGQTIINTERDVFRAHTGMKTAEGRMTIGGPEGNSGLYAVVGDGPKAWETMIDELGVSMRGRNLDVDFVMATKPYSSQRILDLTDEKNLSLLGVTKEELTLGYSQRESTDAYLKSNVIGDLAKERFDGIIFESSKTSTKNIVLFIGGFQ